MNALGASLTLLFCVLVMVLSPRGAVLTIIAAVCYITQAQELDLGLHFPAIRLVLLAGLVRILVRGELAQIRFNGIDGALVAYIIGMMVMTALRDHHKETLIYQFGFSYNALMSYFVLRALLNSEEVVRAVLTGIPWLILPFAVLILIEAATGRNGFAIFGGVDAASTMRDDHVRAEGAFRSPITAGAFGATFCLLFCGTLFGGGSRKLSIFGLAVSSVILICSRSSGPLLGLIVGLISLGCWRYREHTRAIRWGIVGTLAGLHLVMKAPVWFLLGRISDVVGGGGYHRAYLIDSFFRHFSEWALVGIQDTGGWMATRLVVNGQSDLTNQFVSDGVDGGLLCVSLSILVLVRSFQAIGSGLKDLDDEHEDRQWFLWTLGATLACNIAILFSVTYFDQMHVVWYFLLAAINACAFDDAPWSEETEEERDVDDAESIRSERWIEAEAR
jgi:hypothetical protein